MTAGVLVETTGKKRDRSFVYRSYLDRLRVGTELDGAQAFGRYRNLRRDVRGLDLVDSPRSANIALRGPFRSAHRRPPLHAECGAVFTR